MLLLSLKADKQTNKQTQNFMRKFAGEMVHLVVTTEPLVIEWEKEENKKK